MNQIEKQVDRIIVGLKRNAELDNVRFVREYGSHKIETPIKGVIAVVSVTDTTQSKSYIGGYLSPSIKGEEFLAKVEIRVYAPADENGSGLSEIVSEMLTGLKKADNEKIVTESSASTIAFDADLNAIYRTLSFTISFCLCEEA